MKRLTLTIIVLLIFAFFGCMENQLTQPETAFENAIEKTSLSGTTSSLPVIKGEIKLCCDLCDPLAGDCKLQGSVAYIHTTLSNIGGFARIKINFDMKSELYTRLMHCAPYKITGCSCDTVCVNGMGVSFVEKNYEITNRPDVRLGVKYKVTIDGAEVIGTRLHQIDYH